MTKSSADRTLADVLIEKQIITAEQLSQAEALREKQGLGLEQALTEVGIVSSDDIQAIYNDFFQIRALKLEDVEIDPEAVRHIPAAIAHKYHLIPVRRNGGALAVAMAEPTNPEAFTAMRAATDFEIHPFLSRYDAIEHALFLHYGEPPARGGERGDSEPDEARLGPNLIEQNSAAHIGQNLPLCRSATFGHCVEDPANQFALSIAKSVAQFKMVEDYNPFHCWGAPGSGKSMLLYAIANEVTSRSPLKRFILTNGTRFVENLFECIRDNKLNFFRYVYRELDLLLIDDAGALLQHDWAQRELIETYRYMERQNKQMVLAADGNLATEPRLIHDLRIALESGVIAGIGSYSVEGKLNIVKQQVGMELLSDDALNFLATQCGDDLNDLLNVAKQAAVAAITEGREITSHTVEEIAHLYGIDLSGKSTERIKKLLESTEKYQTANESKTIAASEDHSENAIRHE